MKNCDKTCRNIPEKLEIVRRYFRKIKLNDGAKILDVGGTSYYYDILKTIFPYGRILLININPNDIRGVNDSIVGDAIQLPFKDETFDVLTSFDLIEHLTSPDDFLAGSFRVLKWGGGWFVMSTPNLADFYSRLTFLFGYTPFSYDPSKFRIAVPLSKVKHTDRGHKSVFTYKGLKQLLEIHGFKVTKSDGYSYCDPFYLDMDPEKIKREVGFYCVRRILNKVFPKSMREGMLFICRKTRKSDNGAKPVDMLHRG